MKKIGDWFFPDAEEQMRDEVEKTGSWQIKRLERALSHVDSFRTAIDIGAHVGLWSWVLAGKFDDVHAFEPIPEHTRCWDRNLSRMPNADLHQMALADFEGYAKPQIDDRHGEKNTGGTFMQIVSKYEQGCVAVAPLDKFADAIRCVDFMKIDVEGWESMTLVGASEIIRRDRPVIMFEHKPKFGGRSLMRFSPTEVLQTFGYIEVDRCGSDLVWKHEREV